MGGDVLADAHNECAVPRAPFTVSLSFRVTSKYALKGWSRSRGVAGVHRSSSIRSRFGVAIALHPVDIERSDLMKRPRIFSAIERSMRLAATDAIWTYIIFIPIKDFARCIDGTSSRMQDSELLVPYGPGSNDNERGI